MNAQAEIQWLLKKHYSKVQENNPSYSIRAFAKKLGTTATTLSLVMSGKRKVSKKLAASFCEKLLLTPSEVEDIMSNFEKNYR